MLDKELVPVNDRIKYTDIKPSPGSKWITNGNKESYVKKGPDDPFDELRITRINSLKITYILDSRSDLSYETLGDDVKVIGNVYDRQEHST